MKGLGTVSLAVGVALLLAPHAPAQQGPQGRGMFGGGPAQLLQNEGVQKELKLTDDQIKKVKEIATQIGKKHQEEFAKARELDQSERFAKFQELGKIVNEETMKALADVLKPEQEKRLKQVGLQMRGSQAFTEAEVQKELKLTDEQKDKIKTITTDAQKEQTEIFQGAQGNFQEAGKKMQALRKETMEKVTGVLTEDQKKAWKDMCGAPFEFKFQPRQPRRDA